MSVEVPQPVRPVLDEETRCFVRRCLGAGLIELAELKKVVMSLMSQSTEGEQSNTFTPQRLADGLMHAGVLTRWQVKKLLAGRSKGFYLGSYRLLRPLGKGGMGVVYLGEHHVMKRLMALKILPPEASQDERRIERFKSEARACAQLDHVNIVRAYDFAGAGDKLYIVMEYVDGIDLHLAVQRDGLMSIPDAVDALIQATEGLAHAHERGIIHRDIKPSNLLLRTDGVVKVSDLGLARIGWTDDDQEQKRMLGTADFIAPEQAIDSKAAGTRADIYSLGCTFYYLLAGRPPYDGTAAQKLAKHQTAPVPDVREERSDCPAAIAELLMRMMAKKPEDRPKSAVELLSQIKRIGQVAGEPSPRHARVVEPASDTVIDEAVYQATLDDTSLSADGEVDTAMKVEEFDFASLPPVDLGELASPTSMPALQPAAVPKNRNLSAKSNNPKSRSSSENYQQVMLGMGLAFAILALIAVVGMGVYSFTLSDERMTPTVKSLEDGKVIVIRE